jgi:hypothetical protein
MGLELEDLQIGYKLCTDEIETIIRDLYNKYNSQLSSVNQPKLFKIINQEQKLILESKLAVLNELKNKLK